MAYLIAAAKVHLQKNEASNEDFTWKVPNWKP